MSKWPTGAPSHKPSASRSVGTVGGVERYRVRQCWRARVPDGHNVSGGDVLCRMIGHHPFMSGLQIDELGEAEHLALAVLILHNDAGALEVNHDYGGDVAIVPGELRAARSGTRP